jgi:hypothetical protein
LFNRKTKETEAVADTGQKFLDIQKWRRGTVVAPLINTHPTPTKEKMIFNLIYKANYRSDFEKIQQKDCFFKTKNHDHLFWVRMKTTFFFEKERFLSWINSMLPPILQGCRQGS